MTYARTWFNYCVAFCYSHNVTLDINELEQQATIACPHLETIVLTDEEYQDFMESCEATCKAFTSAPIQHCRLYIVYDYLAPIH